MLIHAERPTENEVCLDVTKPIYLDLPMICTLPPKPSVQFNVNMLCSFMLARPSIASPIHSTEIWAPLVTLDCPQRAH